MSQAGARYYVVGGTLLGAVRHKGFIPWDDDIDVAMMREDYERFMQEGQAYLPAQYFLQNYRTDEDYPANFAKIRDSRTTFIESSVSRHRMHHGVYIDVFPLDCYPDGKLQRRWLKFRDWLYVLRISRDFDLPQKSSSPIRQAAKTALRKYLDLRYPRLAQATERRNALHSSVRKGTHVVNHCGAWGAREIIPKAWYGTGAELSFEGLTVTGPAEFDKWLTQVYGDYMQPPPEDKRVAHHYADVIDLHKPYTAYTEEQK